MLFNYIVGFIIIKIRTKLDYKKESKQNKNIEGLNIKFKKNKVKNLSEMGLQMAYLFFF